MFVAGSRTAEISRSFRRAVKLGRVKRRPWRRTVPSANQTAQQDVNGVRLAPIGLALTAALLIGIATATGLVLLTLLALGLPPLQPSGTLPLAGLLDVLKFAFAAIAGI